ncbi:hypothetical protein BDB01DRAFT_155781 [Pilobolus umbonatus]|nr:hypothetical protein BDB01DRAFT_155781 [Pilobolus umbonatus]
MFPLVAAITLSSILFSPSSTSSSISLPGTYPMTTDEEPSTTNTEDIASDNVSTAYTLHTSNTPAPSSTNTLVHLTNTPVYSNPCQGYHAFFPDDDDDLTDILSTPRGTKRTATEGSSRVTKKRRIIPDAENNIAHLYTQPPKRNVVVYLHKIYFKGDMPCIKEVPYYIQS